MSAAATMRRSMNGAAVIISRPLPGSSFSIHQIRCFGIGRMIDMGGMPSGSSDNSILRPVKNASKNSKLQAVAFDFETLTTFGKDQVQDNKKSNANATTSTAPIPSSSSIQPDASRIEQVASLLNVDLPGTATASSSSTQSSTPPPPPTPKASWEINQDVRAKYAKKLQGGIAGIELAKHQVASDLAKGDAPGHLQARKLAMASGGDNASKWMAMSGTGILLSYLSHRSIHLALLPNPINQKDNNTMNHQVLQSMQSLKRQLKDVVIDCIVDPTQVAAQGSADNYQSLLEDQLMDHLQIHPNKILVVSDKDPYLKAAKELGMLTCRLQQPNARRGNVSAHFNIPSLDQVQEVVNEINGISFNAVLNR
ncbi:unnamed protein product [Cylindrotheca closterium]|uniref:Uncharacterized protein n=1 Tax=Cylindrotheca closterium TaxID=2856 RepID=A0AAD2JM17_9STRA|nr:unnamed protein product [Cylindrotheca closterium]